MSQRIRKRQGRKPQAFWGRTVKHWRSLFAISLLLVAGAVSSIADITVKDKDGEDVVLKGFTCETSKNCQASVPIKSDGTEVFTSGAPAYVQFGSAQAVTVSGVSTAAKQPALGTAGSASTDVITVQGISSMTPLLMTLSGTNNINNIAGTISLPTGAATSAKQDSIVSALGSPFQAGGSIANTTFAVTQATSSNLKGQFDPLTIASWGLMSGTGAGTAPTNTQIIGGKYNTSAPSPTNGQTLPFQLDSAGRLIVNVGAGGGSGGTSSSFGSAFPSTGTAIGLTDGTNMVGWPGSSTNGGYVQAKSGAFVDGWNASLGAKADSSCGTDTGTCALLALVKRTNENITSLNSTAAGSVAAGTNIIGKVGIDQTTDGTTNAVHLTAGTNAVGKVTLQYGTTDTVDSVCKTVAKTYTPISITTATTTRIVAPTSSKKTYICSIILQAAGADNVGIVEGTGGTCGTGTAGIIGGTTAGSGLNLAANQGVAFGNGDAAVIATAGTNVDLCLITSAAVNLAGHVAWVQK